MQLGGDDSECGTPDGLSCSKPAKKTLDIFRAAWHHKSDSRTTKLKGSKNSSMPQTQQLSNNALPTSRLPKRVLVAAGSGAVGYGARRETHGGGVCMDERRAVL